MSAVVIDVRANHDTGVSRYGLSLLAAAAPRAAAAGWSVTVVCRAGQSARARAAVAGLPVPVLTPPDDGGFVRRSPWLRALLADGGADLYYTAHYTVDRRCPVPFAFTIHDLNRLQFPRHSYTDAAFAARFGDAELRLIRSELDELPPCPDEDTGEPLFTRYFRALTRDLSRRATRIAAVSDATGASIPALLGDGIAGVDVIPCAVDPAVFRRAAPASVAAARANRGVPGPYLMVVGLAHPHKRLGWLLRHLIAARRRLPPGARVLAVGGHAERDHEVQQILHDPAAAGFVTFTGPVSDRELAALYSGAAALVTASLSEGYGMPPAEAIACGCQAIVTDIPALREALGGSAWYYHPDDARRLTDLARLALAGRLPRHPARPPAGWADSGERLITTLQLALSGAPRGAAQASQGAACQERLIRA